MAAKPYFSKPVRVSTDELMTELLRRVPEHDLADVLRNACFNAQRRMSADRHQRYKCQRFFRGLAQRLTSPDDDLAVVVGIKNPSPQLKLPDMSVEEPSETVITNIREAVEANEYEEALDRMAQPVGPLEQETSIADIAPIKPPSQETIDEFAAALDLPTFDDFKDVFTNYPYCTVMDRKGYGRVLVLGYASGRNRTTNDLIRRNCALNEQTFNKVISILGLFERKKGDIHQHIKVVMYRPGMVIRSWTNVQGQGDQTDQYRYGVCCDGGIKHLGQAKYNHMLKVWEHFQTAAKDPDFSLMETMQA